MQELHCDLFFMMRKSAHVTIVAGFYSPRITLTKFDLILFWMVKLFNPVVGANTCIPDGAIISMLRRDYIGANF
jgi:hypothetical protein